MHRRNDRFYTDKNTFFTLTTVALPLLIRIEWQLLIIEPYSAMNLYG